MLIYVNNLHLNPDNGPDQIIQLVAQWVDKRVKRKNYIDAQRLAKGIREFRLKDGSTLTSRATLIDENSRTYPFWFSAQLTHPDDKTPGRRWTTEIGLYQKDINEVVKFSLLLKTDEVSSRVNTPIQATRPKLIQSIINCCHPVSNTAGLKVKHLTQENARAFLNEVEHEERTYPLIILSTNQDGKYPVEPKKILSILSGLADVIAIPTQENTFAIEKIVGRRFIAFGGAINIVFPGRQLTNKKAYDTVRLDPENISDILADGRTLESEILATITYRTNLPQSWQHISPEKVSNAALHARLTRTIQESKSGEDSQQLKEYIELLEEADRELKAKDEEISRIQSDYQAKDDEARNLAATVESLKHALSGAQSNENELDGLSDIITPLRENIAAIQNGSPRLQQVVDLIATLYSDRVVFLKSAKSSAKESDKAGFQKGKRAFDLLTKLSTDYWQSLARGENEQHAKSAFGQKSYASNEGNALSIDGRKRRTFSYHGQDILMEKHIKDGVKDSVADTLRIHFEWIAEDKKIVIGHCGKHLDF